jgi:uncharacterized integral membrane protein
VKLLLTLLFALFNYQATTTTEVAAAVDTPVGVAAAAAAVEATTAIKSVMISLFQLRDVFVRSNPHFQPFREAMCVELNLESNSQQ